ncbi:hypothetical protein QFZ34_003879 [Phyllobacterium ifriqiyense]|uniref:Uncharacterized protein n=1 Tax=Phyllobacterium ifriqiyense TaxID=314238 RepID=A0ABU0SD59_9HYPH|nr:hypothetical protein [Phyllobacterium ifriqiyense]MDQ0998697.1 hypothetical protein [Phyllobacterium ifriqiyense]
MRFVFLFLLVLGVVFGIGGPWAALNFSGEEIGTWRVYDRPGPYKPVTVTLKAEDAPVRAFVDMQTLRNFIPTVSRTALTAVVTHNGKDVLVETLNYTGSKATNKGSPQGQQIYRDEIGDINPAQDGDYLFTIGPGDFDGLEVAHVDLVLRKNASIVDWRIMPAGIALIVISIAGLLFLRRRRGATPVSVPPQSKWGR